MLIVSSIYKKNIYLLFHYLLCLCFKDYRLCFFLFAIENINVIVFTGCARDRGKHRVQPKARPEGRAQDKIVIICTISVFLKTIFIASFIRKFSVITYRIASFSSLLGVIRTRNLYLMLFEF